MKYLLEEQTVASNDIASRYNAQGKARVDITEILTKKADVDLLSVYVRKIPKTRSLQYLFQELEIYVKLCPGDVLYIQHASGIGYNRFFPLFLRLLHKKDVKLVFIIHDANFLRWGYGVSKFSKKELKEFSYADLIIAHTPAMKRELERAGVRCEIRVLYLFDYLTNDAMLSDEAKIKMKNTVVFAGNLEKSAFIRPFNEIEFNNVIFKFYGIKPSFEFKYNKFYVDKFKPDNVSFIQGGWGLVWDGDSADTCSGVLGDYLHFNSSHKLSLYTAAGLPLIVWKDSGLANWIVEKGIGITISSLKDIDSILPTITEEEYRNFLGNIKKVGNELRQGKHILNALGLNIEANL